MLCFVILRCRSGKEHSHPIHLKHFAGVPISVWIRLAPASIPLSQAGALVILYAARISQFWGFCALGGEVSPSLIYDVCVRQSSQSCGVCELGFASSSGDVV